MNDIERIIDDLGNREYNFFNIIKLKGEKAIFSNEILDFWSPLRYLNGYSEGYEVGLCRVKKKFDYFSRMESHKYSQEILIPIDYDMFVPVAPPLPSPDVNKIIIPKVKVGEIIVLNEGVWHFAAGPVNSKVLNYFVLLRKNTPKNDLKMENLNVKVNIKFI